MTKEEFMKAVKISLAVFALYLTLTEAIVYLNCMLFGCEPSYRPFAKVFSMRFFFFPLVLPLSVGYISLKNKSMEKGLIFSSYYMVSALLIFLGTGVLNLILDSLFSSVFFRAASYFLAAPFIFSMRPLAGRNIFPIFLGAFLLLIVGYSTAGPDWSISLMQRIPAPMKSIIMLFFFPLPPFFVPLSGFFMIFNLGLGVYLLSYHYQPGNIRKLNK